MAATRPFDVDYGVSVNDQDTILVRSGPPIGSDADGADKGCLWLDFLNAHLYQKGDSGTGPELWQFIGADTNWRGEVEVRDDVAVVLPTFTPATNATVDGETIDDQERVLFSNAALGNIYIYDKSAGAFVESTNEETAGDTTFVVRGTDAGKKYTYSGTAWVQTDQASVDEFGFIHTFIGKSGFGSENPTYSSTNVVTQNNSLEAAIGELDAAAGATPVSSTLSAVTGTNTLDSVLVDNVAVVKWLVTVRQGQEFVAQEVWASHDGDASNDATLVDKTLYAKIKTAGTIAGFDIDVVIALAGASQEMRLDVTNTAAADWHATRIPVNF
jgi:hypothetical protein